MLENVSPRLGRADFEFETDYKLVREFYLSGRDSLLDRDRKFFILCQFHFSILDGEVNRKRMEELIARKKILKNIFIHDNDKGRIFYYGRDLSDDEKFKEAVEDLF